MTLSYEDKLSPFPVFVPDLGYVSSPKISKIYSEEIGYFKYGFYVVLLRGNVKDCLSLFGVNEESGMELFKQVGMFYFICLNKNIAFAYEQAFSLFIHGEVVFDAESKHFTVQKDGKTTGIINSENFADVCSLMLELCYIKEKSTKKLKFRSKKAKDLFKFLEEGKPKETKPDKDYAFGNVLSSVCCQHNSINMTNVWDLTIYQLYDQFNRLQIKTPFDINATKWAAWGSDPYDYKMWYKSLD